MARRSGGVFGIGTFFEAGVAVLCVVGIGDWCCGRCVRGQEVPVLGGIGLVTWICCWGSDKVANGFFGADHGAGGEGFAGGAGIDLVGHEAILVFVDLAEEFEPEVLEFAFFEVTFEEGVLDAHAVVFADFGNAGQAFVVGDVVGDEGEHFVLSWRVGLVWELGEGGVPPVFDGCCGHGSVHEEGFELGGIFKGGLVHDGLLFDLLAQGGAVSGGFGEELAFHAAFVLKDEFFASFVVEVDAAVFGFEVFGVEDLVAEEVQRKGFDKHGAKGFEQIQ